LRVLGVVGIGQIAKEVHMHGFRILHVDDEPDIREVVELSLGLDPCFEVQSCASGAEALAAAAEAAPDLVLCDVVMPVMDGPATLGRLRASPWTAKTPVIFMTARVECREVEHLKMLGAIGVIYKPFEPMTLASEIRDQVRTAAMTALSSNFSARLRSDAAALTKFRSKCTDKQEEPAAIEQIKSIAHALASAAGIFGCERIGAEAATVARTSVKRLRGEGKPGELACELDNLLAYIANQ
jgi:CheY-like chemotaxis protein